MAYKCPTITIPGYTVTCEYVSNNNGKTYTSGQTLPTVDEADEFQILVSVPGDGDYCMCNFMYFKSNDGKILAGWTLYDVYVFRGTINYKVPMPSSINGKNVTQYAYYREFGSGLLDSTVADKLITGPVLPSGLKDISGCFEGCVNLQGLLEVNCNPTYYSNWLTGRTSSSPSLKLYGKSTMLSTLASGYSNVSVYIKMQAQLLAQRCNSSHQLDDEGTRMKLSLKIKGDNVGVNYTAAIKVNNSLVMTKGFTLNSSAEQTIVWYIDNTYSVDTTYDVSVTITSKYSNQTIETINVSDTLTTAFYTMDFGNNGHQIAFGKPANANASDIPVNGRFDCAMDADFQGNVSLSAEARTNLGLTDTGWVNLTTKKGTWKHCQYRYKNGIVYIRGYATAYAWSGSTGDVVVAAGTIPSQYRPPDFVDLTVRCAGARWGQAAISPEGGIFVDRILNGTTAYTTSNWIRFNVSYPI